jgi:hypothetical protein
VVTCKVDVEATTNNKKASGLENWNRHFPFQTNEFIYMAYLIA